MKHVLAVDDDAALRSMIAEYLSAQGFRVSTVASGREMTHVLARDTVDLAIIDMKLAEEDGLELVRDLKARSRLPIIVVSGHRRDEIDRVLGLELGADDYLTKPFSLRELVARIRAVLRRSGSDQGAGRSNGRSLCRFSGWELDLRNRRLTSPTGGPVALTRGEFDLLMALIESPQRVLTREQLLAAARVHGDEVYDRSVDVQVLRLRRKIEEDPNDPKLIRTERGVGYLFATSVEFF